MLALSPGWQLLYYCNLVHFVPPRLIRHKHCQRCRTCTYCSTITDGRL